MTIYAAHRHSAKAETPGPLEAFPSVERASVALQLRARKQESGTYYLDDNTDITPRPPVAFPEADLTGYLLVWRRKATEPRPEPGEDPEEVWHLSPGGAVIKEPYAAKGPAYELPALTPQERRQRAIKAAQDLSPVSEAFHTETDGMLWRRILTDIVQDPEAEDAILRLVQGPPWKTRGK